MISSLSGSSGYGGVGASSTLQKFFGKADANNDSSLTKDELVSALGQSKTASKVGSDRLSSAVDGLIGSLDTDSSGSLSATEFSSFGSQFDYGSSSLLLQAQENSGGQQRYQALYSSLDSDSSGGVSQDELSSAVSSYLSATGQSSSDSGSLSSSLFSGLDSDGDGSVSQSELTSAMKAAESNRPPPPMGPPPANDTGSAGNQASSGGSSGTSSSSSTSSSAGASASSSSGFDPLDTNQDGYVSAEERLAGTDGTSSQQSGVTSSRLGSGTLRFLMNSINEVAA